MSDTVMIGVPSGTAPSAAKKTCLVIDEVPVTSQYFGLRLESETPNTKECSSLCIMKIWDTWEREAEEKTRTRQANVGQIFGFEVPKGPPPRSNLWKSTTYQRYHEHYSTISLNASSISNTASHRSAIAWAFADEVPAKCSPISSAVPESRETSSIPTPPRLHTTIMVLRASTRP
ncbi:uncharacterized protein BDZ99DRAFT_504463 [Mytilinidion resinicola]|uniref:Uncharacterized protein n=1 Tax=Mytilinidion resinicola TaxID=574789 RepID=A0A6A6XY83_9PEZI|nr:uncharacterized protein BDZ99DRAFT_504463 [Mytilinidion resinicola]KAF2801511.1 hypothetical protein BDZ99DRAFT_504463 [Mytilinidion resinicola]